MLNDVPSPGRLVSRYGPAVPLDDRLHNRQAQAAAGLPGSRSIYLIEPIEDVRQVVWGDARPGIADRNGDNSVLNARAQRDAPPARRVPQRVRGEVLKRLFKPHRIAGDDLRPGRDVGSQLHALSALPR